MLTDDAVVFKEYWRSIEVPINSILSVKRDRVYGISPVWVIHRKDGSVAIVKVANFTPREARTFAEALVERNPEIQFTALPLGKNHKTPSQW